MSTTSLKLPDALKAQAAEAARSKGMTTHAFMVEAIKSAAAMAQQRAQFVEQALAAKATLAKSGKGFAADEVHAHLRQRVKGGVAKPLSARSWQK